MTENVLVPVDGSEQAERALDYALELFPDGSVTLLNVREGRPDTQIERKGGDPEDLLAERREMLARLVEAREHGDEIETEVTRGKATREIVDFADEHDVDYIVIGSHGRDTVSRVLLGSVAETVVRRSAVPVLVVN